MVEELGEVGTLEIFKNLHLGIAEVKDQSLLGVGTDQHRTMMIE